MRGLRRSLLLASFLAAAPLALIGATSATAQVSINIGFDSFHGELANYGDWLYSDRWGEVWRPDTQDRDPDWRPYWAGHWVDTDEYGWTWISDERPWGEIAYHYGRWVFDPDDGWLWLPGYVWSPAWVVWRSAGDDVGWMPMPPDDDFLRPSGISIGVNFGDWNDTGGYYGYSRWYGSDFDENRFGGLWVFVPGGRLSDPGYRRYALARPQTVNIVRQSRNITNYTIVNNTIINRSVNANVVRGAGGRAPQPVHASTVLRNNRWVAPVNQGEQIQQRARQERPHGNGTANSAPKPTQQQIQSLSTRAIPVRTQNNAPGNTRNNQPNRGGGGGSHLFNRNNVAQFAAARGQQAQPAAPAQPNAQQPGRPEAQPNQPPRGNPRERNPGSRPENNAPENRGPQAEPSRAPGNPAPAAPSTPERNRGLERPQQQEAAPATPPQQQQQQERTNRFQRERPQETPQSAPQRAAPPTPERQAAPERPERPTPPTPPPAEDRGNRPQRSFERGPQPPAMEQRQPERPATPERAAPPSPPREAPQRPAVEQRPPPQAQQREQRPAEAARPNPSADRGQERGANPDRGNQRKPDNDNH